jgi:HAD superfamily hydrolase (TIGR01509 family)
VPDRPPLDAVLFDMDGTLFDSSEVVPDAFADTIRRLGGPSLSRDEVIGSYVIGPPEPIMVHFLGRPVEPAELDAYHERLAGEAERRHLQPYPGIVEALDRLATQVPIGVFTNADRGNAAALLGATGLLRRFAVVVGADEVAPNFKPHPDGLLLACERLGIDPARTAYVGDSPLDVEVAHRAGALAVAAGWGHLHEAAVEADVRVRLPAEIPAALALDGRRTREGPERRPGPS